VQTLSDQSRQRDELPGDHAKAVVQEAEGESDDTNDVGGDARWVFAADLVLRQAQSRQVWRLHEPCFAVGTQAQVLPLRC
jgi:hypothetical protein